MRPGPITVKFEEFADAAGRVAKMTRAPRGARSEIPRDTLLLADSGGVVVQTAVVSSLVHATKSWMVDLSVDAKVLIRACNTIRKLGASNQEIELGADDRHLRLKFRTTTITVPAFWIKEAARSSSKERIASAANAGKVRRKVPEVQSSRLPTQDGDGVPAGWDNLVDEDTFKKALPYFMAALQHFSPSTSDMKGFANSLEQQLKTFGMPEAGIRAMRPYLKRFVLDLESGTISCELPRQEPSGKVDHAEAAVRQTGADKRSVERVKNRPLPKPKAEEGADGKMQLVIPGAERVTQRKLAKMKADAPLRPKADQRFSGGLLSGELQQLSLFATKAALEESPPVGTRSSKPIASKRRRLQEGLDRLATRFEQLLREELPEDLPFLLNYLEQRLSEAGLLDRAPDRSRGLLSYVQTLIADSSSIAELSLVSSVIWDDPQQFETAESLILALIPMERS